MNRFVNKNTERLHYAMMVFSLNTGYILCCILSLYYNLFGTCKKERKGIVFFPYTQRGSDGYKRRIGQYEKLLSEMNVCYNISGVDTDEYILGMLQAGVIERYKLFRKIFWTRFRQVLSVGKYKSVFIQRSLFPYYPDQKFPWLEKLAFNINSEITIDFWDSVWVYDRELTEKSVQYCKQISCVNSFIAEHFKDAKAEKTLFPIAMDLDEYLVKKQYSTGSSFRLFYTGNPGNVESFLAIILPVLETIKNEIDITLVIVTRHRCSTGNIRSEFHDFSENSFFKLLAGSDIGLYAIEDSEISHGKMAMKVLDYMATALPIIASPYGLPQGAVHMKNMIIADSAETWVHALKMACGSQQLREQLGKEARRTVEAEHNLSSSVVNLVKLLGG